MGARLVFRPLRVTDPQKRAASARAAYAAVGDRALRAGDVVTAEGESFVVRAVEPGGLVRPDPDTAIDFDFAAPPPKRAVAEVVFLVDTSYSMRGADLAPTRLEAVKRALATALANGGDVVRRASVMSFAGSVAVAAPFAAPASVDLPALDPLVPRGPGKVAPALDAAIEHVVREGDERDEAAVFLATDSDADPGRLRETALRAARLGVQVHVLDAGAPDAGTYRKLAADTGGTYHDAHAGVTFRPALQALAQRFGVPLPWRDPARVGGEVEFEVVLRAMTEREAADFPALPRRIRRK